MRALQMFFGAVAATALLGAGVVVAEIRYSIEPLKFSVSTEDGSITLPVLEFCNIDSTGGEETQTPCMMAPGGPLPNLLMELPVMPLVAPAQTAEYTSAQAAIAPISSLRSSAPYNERRLLGVGSSGVSSTGTASMMSTVQPPVIVMPEYPSDPPPVVAIPEPATLVVVGLGIGGVVAARRWREKKEPDAVQL